ncbi:MAG: DNA methyltransferase [Acidobacteriota bacterium]
MAVPDRIHELIERFKFNESSYRSGSYNETQLRREFLDPFFEELGWDVHNRQGYAEAYKDVIHEDAIKVGGATKAPDYCFRIGGARKFFLEAKKPAVNIKEDISPAFQLRRYAWSAKLPLSVLSDFEEFAVYDCRTEPVKTDKASTARILYCRYPDYPDKWDEIAGIFSKQAILKGSFDKYASGKNRKGTQEVDAAFLKDIEAWRDALAKNLALRNPALTTRQLNFAVQRTIDRLIFLRICEDRGIENYGRLQSLLKSDGIYPELCKLFQHADDRYNSGLFHFRKEKDRLEPPDDLTLKLSLDDKPLKEILRKLYYPDSPYEFSVLPADILGQVYEQFLGKVIRLTAGHQAKVEEKPEVRKAGGVYYTPTYIVDYIVKQTVGKLCEGKTPKEVAKLRILDPACGSGSFLLGAYQFLLDWHRDWYTQHEPEKLARGKNSAIFQGSNGDWRLSTGERKRILLNNIYGVDIDAQAVETTKLSLLLKVLEGETAETVGQSQRLFQERALPDLGDNIKCGNSLIGPDFYDREQLDFFDEEERLRINDFNWTKEFAQIMRGGGFDAVIGNPPYVRQESLTNLKEYFGQNYKAFDGVADLYVYFIERSIGLLCPNGLYSIIVSSSFLRTTFAAPLRKWLGENAAVLRIVDFGGLAVFEKAKDTYVCIPLLSKSPQPKNLQVCKVRSFENLDLDSFVPEQSYEIPQSQLTPNAWAIDGQAQLQLFQKIMGIGIGLGKYVEGRFFRGVTTGLNESFVIDTATRKKLIAEDSKSSQVIKPLLQGEDVRRWHITPKDRWLIFTRRGINIDAYPAIKNHLAHWKAELTPKQSREQIKGRKPGRYQWYEIQDDVAYYEIFESPKIIFPDIAKEPRFYLDKTNTYLANTGYALGTDDTYLLGILNSKLFWFAISNISIPFGVRAGKFRYRLIYQYMEKVPIRPINFKDPTDRARHDRMVKLVEQMLALHRQLSAARTAHEQTSAQRQIDSTDRQIDRLVYELYELTEDEIRIVEAEAA